VGKSSLINMLLNAKRLARTSVTPGRTQLINHFLVNDDWYLVDLPGYGFAKAPKNLREKWQKTLRRYLSERENLYCVFVLIDSRIPPQKIDLEFVDWLGEVQVPFVLAFTKADKQHGRHTQTHAAAFRRAMKERWDELPPIFVTSAKTRQGRHELLAFIDKVNKDARQPGA